MKAILIVVFFMLMPCMGFAQTDLSPINKSISKGRMYFYWGYNRGWFTNSDIHFKGSNYDFTLKDVVAKDRQSKLAADPYLKLNKLTIPQYNLRIGYYLTENWDISFGIDHMKYVMQQDQTVEINGYIHNTSSNYNADYSNNDIQLTGDFLKFEHTDGLNYVNVEVRHSNLLFDFNKIKISLNEGLGIGFLYPRTNTTLLGQQRHDDFHVAGYGIGGVVGARVAFFNKFFIQSEFKGGYINLPDVETTYSELDKAKQMFFFSQLNIVFGGIINLHKKK
ncbi:hypothetical protein Fleli_0361 [Bernardetia litoralis DSM 6794]|uniref:Outer membrane protein beta-barrel domain-containing protein n=1 Tax=Bernardetia litoralis (strain ATCC 23117 / DSM 6794 / NBRC 15988 / NCIMB 1366 / Fx l1 / Sio-4) TaxID=880071 RepID=I4AFV6_BERLS|nr:hypothetical protein [Bernardetia litoralis]AFM02841.1 hypothetical protein Fleli_0361 [Bernardetia litoralis DSM 6794]